MVLVCESLLFHGFEGPGIYSSTTVLSSVLQVLNIICSSAHLPAPVLSRSSERRAPPQVTASNPHRRTPQVEGRQDSSAGSREHGMREGGVQFVLDLFRRIIPALGSNHLLLRRWARSPIGHVQKEHIKR